MNFKLFLKELNGNRVEGKIIKSIFFSLAASLIFLAILYFFKFRLIEEFIPKYGAPLFFMALSYAFIMPVIKQIGVYREMPCMSGMMVGMTSGMISGFLPGFYVASTNGMFVGGFFGVALGILIGIWNGKCCGIMGIMEGIMAGFMGGLMGAMTAFMLLNDNLKIAAIIVFIICSAVLFGLNYLIYKEMQEHHGKAEEGPLFILTLTIILIAVTTWLMVYGPKSGAVG